MNTLRIVCILTGDFDLAAFPIPPAPIEPDPKRCVHTPSPSGYTAAIDFAELASKTHSQVRCPHCGLWKIWMEKRLAKEYEQRLMAEAEEADRRCHEEMATRRQKRKSTR